MLGGGRNLYYWPRPGIVGGAYHANLRYFGTLGQDRLHFEKQGSGGCPSKPPEDPDTLTR